VAVGDQLSLSIRVTGTDMVPKVTLFNGAGAAITTSTQSPYNFTYTVQAGDVGPIIYTVEAEDQAGNTALVTLRDDGRTAGVRLPACSSICAVWI